MVLPAGTDREWGFGPAPKIGRHTHRTVPTDETLARVVERARLVPITRVADLTPIDWLRLPVYGATTPLAKDLTTHFGKGLDASSAKLSAMAEAIERVSAEAVGAPIRHASFADLASGDTPVLDPHDCDLPDDTRYHDGQVISWVEGLELVTGKPVWVPVDLAVTPPVDGVLRHVDTNGLAAGNTLLEAVVHGLCEVIERDALGQWLFQSLFADPDHLPGNYPVLLPDSLPSACRPWLDRVAAAGMTLITEVLPQDVGIPVFRSILVDPWFPGPQTTSVRTFFGLGAAPNAAIAAIRSITEAVQSRVGVVHGARDDFNSLAAPWRPSAPSRDLADVGDRPKVPLQGIASFESDDLFDEYRFLVDRLARAGMDRVIAVDLTRADFGIPVVRVRVPGLTSFAVNRRRAGWRCLRHLL